MRVVHYLNQFFGGLGGEEEAGAAPQIKDGAVGPGRLLEQVLGEGAQVVRTIICGDNYAAENLDELTELILCETAEADAELFVAGPCFEAGRYGVASGAVCSAVAAELDIPSVTGMALETPAWTCTAKIYSSLTRAKTPRPCVMSWKRWRPSP